MAKCFASHGDAAGCAESRLEVITGQIIEVLLRCVGLDWSRSGQTVWRVADPTSKLFFRAPEKSGSLRPAAARPTTIGSLDTAELEHDEAEITICRECALDSLLPRLIVLGKGRLR